MSAAAELSVVVPLHRTARTVDALYARLAATLQPALGYEAILVDDACPEGSGSRARALAARDPRVGVLSLARNVGQHRAVVLGLARTRGAHVAVLDGDLQDPPEAIPSLLEVARRGFDAVFAGRRGRYEAAGRLLTSRLFKRALWLRYGLPADAGLYVVMSRRLADAVAADGSAEPFVQVLIGRSGLPTTSVPVERSPRPVGSTAYTGRARARLAWHALRAAFRPWPVAAARAPEPPLDFLPPACRVETSS